MIKYVLLLNRPTNTFVLIFLKLNPREVVAYWFWYYLWPSELLWDVHGSYYPKVTRICDPKESQALHYRSLKKYIRYSYCQVVGLGTLNMHNLIALMT